MPTRAYEPLLVHIDLDGTPLGYRRLIDPLPLGTYDIQAFPRPGGVLAAATVTQESEGSATGVLLVALDEAFQPLSQRFLGDDTWLRAIAPYPDGTTLLSVDFSGLLELGPLGVGVDGPAIAVGDDEGRARWAEVLYAQSPHTITATAVAPDGAVLVAGYASDGGVLRISRHPGSSGLPEGQRRLSRSREAWISQRRQKSSLPLWRKRPPDDAGEAQAQAQASTLQRSGFGQEGAPPPDPRRPARDGPRGTALPQCGSCRRRA